MKNMCVNCRHWVDRDVISQVRYGECHAHPPAPVALHVYHGKKTACQIADWPLTNEDNDCGEFKKGKRNSAQ